MTLLSNKFMTIKAAAVFCGSKSGNNKIFEQHTIELAHILAQNGVNIIYGGGNKGLMGTLANAAIEKKGNIIGIMPELLKDFEHHHQGLTELLIVDSMHTRKKLLYEKCDAAIILPGGYGTLDEVFEMLTWNQLKIHQKDMFIMNSAGFYNSLINHIETMKDNGFLYEDLSFKIHILSKPSDIISFLK